MLRKSFSPTNVLVALILAVLVQNSFATGSIFFSAPSFATQSQPTALVAADFNNDGKIDLAVANSGSDSVSILLNNGHAGFQPAVNFGTGSFTYSVAAADFDSDGKIDLVIGHYGLSTISVLMGNGDGTFDSGTSFSTGTTPLWVVAADFNEDGNPDVATANNSSNDISILIGRGDGTFRSAVNVPSAGSMPIFLAVADFNADGHLDLAVVNQCHNKITCTSGSFSVLLGKGDGKFQPGIPSYVKVYPDCVAIGDLNGDGKLDIVANAPQNNSVIVRLGNGDGT